MQAYLGSTHSPPALRLWQLSERLRLRALDNAYNAVHFCPKACTPVKPCKQHHGAWSFIAANMRGVR